MEYFNGFVQPDLKLSSLLDFSPLNQAQKNYLTKVYAFMSYAICMCAFGSIFSNYVFALPRLLCLLAPPILILVADMDRMQYHHSQKYFTNKRFSLYSASFFLMGSAIGTILYWANEIDPTIIPTAFFGTLAIFTCFTISSFFLNQRTLLYPLALFTTVCSFFTILSIMNLFFRSSAIDNLTLYMGLFIFMGYIIYDTQVILKQFERGNTDYFAHSYTLFTNFVSIFIRLTIILMKNTKERECRENSKNHRHRR